MELVSGHCMGETNTAGAGFSKLVLNTIIWCQSEMVPFFRTKARKRQTMNGSPVSVPDAGAGVAVNVRPIYLGR